MLTGVQAFKLIGVQVFRKTGVQAFGLMGILGVIAFSGHLTDPVLN